MFCIEKRVADRSTAPLRLAIRIEFGFGVLKILLIVGMILAGLIVDWGGSPSGEFIGGRNWHTDPIKEYLVKGSTGRFLAFWAVLSEYILLGVPNKGSARF